MTNETERAGVEVFACQCGCDGDPFICIDSDGTERAALKPCPNPWCEPSISFPPTLKWGGMNACYVECGSCGMEGPNSSPVLFNDDGEEIGTQDAEACAITAWNTRTTAEAGKRELVDALRAIVEGQAPRHGRWHH